MNLTNTNQQGFAPVTLDEAMRFSDMLAKSSMVPKAYQGKPEDVLVAVQWGKELGLAPLQALQNIACINGKPSVYGDAAMALVQNSPVCEGIEERIDGEGTPNPVAVCVARRKGRQPVTATFSVEDAKRAGLWGKQGPWQAYPKRMLQMRARGFALRDAFPDVLKGLITAEEAADYPSDVSTKAIHRNPLDALAAPKPAPIVVPEITSEPAVIHAIMEHDQEMDDINKQLQDAAEPDVVVDVTPEEQKPISSESWTLFVPGKDKQTFNSYEEWSEAYESLADKVAKAKLSAKDKTQKLKALRDDNMITLERIGALERVHHTAAHSKRLSSLTEKEAA